MIVSVKNFGQIASASIDMSNFSLFVGHNNSGKTMMMQLIYGVIDYLTRRIDISEHYTFGELPITIDNTNFPEIETAVNKVLHDKKDEIVFNTFNRPIPIEELWVELGEIGHTFLLKKMTIDDTDTARDIIHFAIMIKADKFFLLRCDNSWLMRSKPNPTDRELIESVIQAVFSKILLNNTSDRWTRFLFLPASRTGILLLYKQAISNSLEMYNKQEENEFGLTQPVWEFMLYMLRYKQNPHSLNNNHHLLSFINDHLIDGDLQIEEEEVLYTPKGTKLKVPFYLTSSMVNELSPLIHVLTTYKTPRCIFYDEVETCLHPLKQIQMARLLVRMVNADYKMIISTHSDTMAAAINNLILLSASEQKEQKAQALSYDENDFLKPEKLSNVHVYQFIPDKTGRTVVTELSPYFASGHGYNFDIFNASNDKIYHDAMTILEDA